MKLDRRSERVPQVRIAHAGDVHLVPGGGLPVGQIRTISL